MWGYLMKLKKGWKKVAYFSNTVVFYFMSAYLYKTEYLTKMDRQLPDSLFWISFITNVNLYLNVTFQLQVL